MERLKFNNYNEIIEQARERMLTPEPGYEFHHILPKALGGADSLENLVKLTTFEHILAHYFLALDTRNPKMFYAFNCITMYQFNHISELEKITLENLDYWTQLRQEAREMINKANHLRKYINRGGVRKRVFPEEIEHYVKEGWELGRGPMTPEWREHAAKARVGLHRSEKTRRKMREAVKRRWQEGTMTNPMAGKHHSEESKALMRERKLGKPNLKARGVPKSEEHRRKISETLKNKPRRIMVNKDGIRKKVLESEIDSWLKDGWVRGKGGKNGE